MTEFEDPRVYALLDFDCFQVQFEFKGSPDYFEKPCAAGRKIGNDAFLISTNYVARNRGLGKRLTFNGAKKLVPDLCVRYVREVDGKVLSAEYETESKQIFQKFSDHCSSLRIPIQQMSIDEFLLDLTDVAKLELSESDYVEDKDEFTRQLLEKAGVICEKLRNWIWSETGYQMSAGIAVNKVYAKLCCFMNRPYGQTILFPGQYEVVLKEIPIENLLYFGGSFGLRIKEQLGVKSVHDLLQFSQDFLENLFGQRQGRMAYHVCRGVDKYFMKSIPVKPNVMVKCSLTLKDKETQLDQTLTKLCILIKDDSLKYGRFPTTLFVKCLKSDLENSKKIDFLNLNGSVKKYLTREIESLMSFDYDDVQVIIGVKHFMGCKKSMRKETFRRLEWN